jgi:pSer/pThr/pTyr-binding forkhead associated (FHA) protein
VTVISEPLSPFLEACGASEGLRLAVQAPGHEEESGPALRQPYAVVGRGSGADIVLDDPGVSRPRHAYLQFLGGRVFCLDLGSRTGIHWPAGPQLQGWLDPDDTLRLGSSRVRLLNGGDPMAAGEPDRTDPLAAGSLASDTVVPFNLEFRIGARRQLVWRPDRLLTLVGNDPGCKFWLRSKHISRFHCSLVHTRAGLWVVDLLSREGVYLNGSRIRCARLCPNDEVRVGPFILRVGQEVTAEPGGQQMSSSDTYVPPALPAPASTEAPLGVAQTFPQALVAEAAKPVEPRIAGVQLSTVIGQFALMQQQMFDQFQQALGMMVQMFRGLFEDQKAQVRQELEHVRALTIELHTLQAQLNLHTLANQQRANASAQAPAAQPEVSAETAAMAEVASLHPSPAPEPVDAIDDLEEACLVSPAEALTPELAASDSAPGPAPAVEETVAAAVFPSPEATPRAAPPDPEKVHAWLLERMAVIQKERQGRWQKIMDFFSSAGS